jgi:tetratricopeptide (TPR) repeat protein
VYSKIRAVGLATMLCSCLLALSGKDVRAQGFGGNTVSGNIYGVNRQPMADIWVELLDDFHRTIQRTRTTGGGYYEFRGFPQGNYYVRVNTLGGEYEEQEQSFQIQNTTSIGNRVGGFANESLDIYLKLRPGINPAAVAIFVQDVPSAAEKLYKKAIADLDANRESEGLAELRSAIEIFPKYFFALERLGREYIKMGKPETYKAAAILLDSAVQVNPRSFQGWYGLAYALVSIGNTAGAGAAIQKALELNSYSADALYLSGWLLRRDKNYTEAEKQLIKARDAAKNALPQIHRELGLLYGQDLKKYALAAKELKIYLKAKPDAKDAADLRKLIDDYETRPAT